jgi:hypothetical protein
VIAGHKEMARKITQIERKLGDHDEQIMVLMEAIKQPMEPKPLPKKRPIGFQAECPNKRLHEEARNLASCEARR